MIWTIFFIAHSNAKRMRLSWLETNLSCWDIFHLFTHIHYLCLIHNYMLWDVNIYRPVFQTIYVEMSKFIVQFFIVRFWIGYDGFIFKVTVCFTSCEEWAHHVIVSWWSNRMSGFELMISWSWVICSTGIITNVDGLTNCVYTISRYHSSVE